MDASITERIREILTPILDARGLSVFDIERAGRVVRVTLDRPDGNVDIGDCTEVSNFLSHALDVDDPIPGAYDLEVSSPGLDRPLRNPGEFQRFIGRLCRVKLRESPEQVHTIVGRIRDVSGENITVDPVDGPERVIAFGNVIKARLEVEF